MSGSMVLSLVVILNLLLSFSKITPRVSTPGCTHLGDWHDWAKRAPHRQACHFRWAGSRYRNDRRYLARVWCMPSVRFVVVHYDHPYPWQARRTLSHREHRLGEGYPLAPTRVYRHLF